MASAGIGGDIVYVVSKNAIAAGPENVAYGAAKADQAHQVRLLAAELGPARHPGQRREPRRRRRGFGHLRRRVARGSAPPPTAWRPRTSATSTPSRTLLGEEVLPEHVADAVFALVGGALSRTTGLLVPVDGGVAAAFLR